MARPESFTVRIFDGHANTSLGLLPHGDWLGEAQNTCAMAIHSHIWVCLCHRTLPCFFTQLFTVCFDEKTLCAYPLYPWRSQGRKFYGSSKVAGGP